MEKVLELELGFKPDTRGDVQRAMARAVATLGATGGDNPAAIEEIRNVIEKDATQLYYLLGGRKKGFQRTG